ncbi:MAG: hypothetical protein JST26_00660 [Bacteroidetes bacterium]|nr:hypothetical protein [Bacteroidota bacterium]
MMQQKIFRFLPLCCLAVLAFSSCKKDYDCVCTNSSGSYTAGTTKDTKMRAKKYCQGLGSGETTCKVQ